MGRPYQILLPLLSLFLVRVDLTDLFPMRMEVKVLKVYDGDTILVRHGSYQMRIRLLKIDAPELGQKYLIHSGDAGEYSSQCLKKNLKVHTTQTLIVYKMDMYRRILGEIEGLSLKLIQQGCASLYPYAEFDSKKEKSQYLTALKKAKAQKVGLWKYGGHKRPDIFRKFKKRTAHRQ